jgi:AAA+ ATPase superfamily predicted ATPase
MILDEGGTFLYDEVRFLLQQERRELRNYLAILEAAAADAHPARPARQSR